MRVFKKMIAMELSLTFLVGMFSGCGDSSGNLTDSDRISVASTIDPDYEWM